MVCLWTKVALWYDYTYIHLGLYSMVQRRMFRIWTSLLFNSTCSVVLVCCLGSFTWSVSRSAQGCSVWFSINFVFLRKKITYICVLAICQFSSISKLNSWPMLYSYGTGIRYSRQGRTFKMYSISTRLRVNNHRSFFFHLNIFVIWRHLATYDASWQPLPVNLVLRYTSFICLFGTYFLCFGTDVLSRMSSSLLCIYLLHFLCHIRLANV